MSDPYADAISPDRSHAVLNTGEVVPLMTFFDGQEETDDRMAAHVGIGQMADGRWITVEFKWFKTELRN